jgi:hypothetical protein
MLSLSTKYKTEEVESFHDDAYPILASYLKQLFLTALLFTTENDITLNLIKKSRKHY